MFTSPLGRNKQIFSKNTEKKKLKKQSVYWHEDFKKIPKNPVFAVANEFFDALGVDQAF